MTADVGRASMDGRAAARGDVPHDEGVAREPVENGEAVAIPSVGGFLRGLGLVLAQAGPVTREARRLARDTARIVRGTDEHLPNAGHVASLVNPPSNPRATYWAGGEAGTDPETWQAGAVKHTGGRG